ncbi:MAG: hypothetical protein AB2L24_27725 [Mangrovibacterium sp.]
MKNRYIGVFPAMTAFVILSLILTGCTGTISGDQIDLTPLKEQFRGTGLSKARDGEKAISEAAPASRDELSSMRTVVKIYNGAHDAGLTVPGFGGIKLGKSETNLNVYYVETKMVKTGTDTLVYGIGYSTHYLFKKLKRGIDVSNLASVAASAQLEGNKTSVYYSLQTFGVKSLGLVGYFKPQVNSNFNVDGFGVIQSSIDGIHHVLSDSLLSRRTSFEPMELKFLKPADLQQ